MRFHIETKGGSSLAFIEAHNHHTAAMRYFKHFGDLAHGHLLPPFWQDKIGDEYHILRATGEPEKDGSFYLGEFVDHGVYRTVSNQIVVRLIVTEDTE